MQKTAKVDFYTVDIESTGLETILRDLHGTAADSSKRNVEINDDWIRLARGSLTDRGYLGDLMRISMAPAGFRADLAGKVTTINLSKDEGVAECSAFYFDFETGILTLQRNSRAASWRQLGNYFKRVADLDTDVQIKPLLRPTEMSKVRVLPILRKVHISSAVVDLMATLDNIDEGSRQLIRQAALAESPAIELVLKAGREKEATLNHAVVHEVIESWLRIHADFGDEENEIVKKIVVTGKDETGATVEFDLLRDKLFTTMRFEWVPDDEALWKTRGDEIFRAWELNKANLKRLLPK
ncbi:MAG: hypothetical protein NWR21_13605 [Verrucomicrobiales bacterium]|jgi:hypothetical protein|nr:hypothetical protein [Verrucomicrobiales bacterium]MDP4638791.1 hypothetical protein [Verrucomicrobiales bacterium]MDP4792711.1 hypothetical protein [Verrucomicrobiales bacterium]MDP4940342.1 hypothetical protein [Verrucomicrobiales bacterium]MDP5007213.1 hypothetical protein [Verrucomicrobiales bacterium]